MLVTREEVLLEMHFRDAPFTSEAFEAVRAELQAAREAKQHDRR